MDAVDDTYDKDDLWVYDVWNETSEDFRANVTEDITLYSSGWVN